MRDTTLAVLAGGESARMGTSKAALMISGEPILGWLIDQIQWQGPTLLVTAPGREHPPGASRYQREVSDPVAGLGPLRGILTALEAAATSLVVVTTVDMPGVRAEHVRWLANQLQYDPATEGIILSRERGADRVVEPFPSAFRKSAFPQIVGQLERQRRAVHSLATLDGFRVIEAPGSWLEGTWANLNTPQDFAAFENSLGMKR